MRNVRVVSFKEGVIEAGTTVLRTRREEVIQEDQLYPYAMTNHGAYLAIANMDKNLEIIGDLADPIVLKDLGWSVPECVFEGKGLPPEVMVPKNIYPMAPQAPAVVKTPVKADEAPPVKADEAPPVKIDEAPPVKADEAPPVKASEEPKKAFTDVVLEPEARILEEKVKDEPKSKKKHNR